MLFTFEISNPFQKNILKFVGEIRGKRTIRICWLWFAICYIPLDAYSYHNAIRSGEIIWIN